VKHKANPKKATSMEMHSTIGIRLVERCYKAAYKIRDR